MNLKSIIALSMTAGMMPWTPCQAATLPTPGTKISAAPIEEATPVTPGRYNITVAPGFNASMARRHKEALEKLGLTNVTASSDQSILRFTVKEGSQIRPPDIQKAVAETQNGAAISTPVLEGSTTPHLGL